MPLRVTQGMINTNFLRNMNNNLTRMSSLQEQLATGRRLNKPSDDPVGLSFALRYRSELAANDQYQENVDSAISWLDYTDSTLNKAGEVFNRIRELAVQGANGTNPQSANDAIKSEVAQLYSEMVTIANSDFNGKHVFNGQTTDLVPYQEATAMNNVTENSAIQFEIGAGVRIAVNVTGNTIFGATDDTDNAFKVINDIVNSLGTSDTKGVSDALAKLDSRIDSFLGVRANVGAKINRVQLSANRLEDISGNLQALQTKVEDIDIAEAITNMKTAENVYQSSLSVGAKIIQPSLVDFLR